MVLDWTRATTIATVYLLQQVVLLVTHHQVVATVACLFFALLKLVFERLGVDSDSTVTDDLLPRAGGNATIHACSRPAPELTDSLKPRVKRQ